MPAGVEDFLEDGDPLFEILLDAGVLPNRASIQSNLDRFVEEYTSSLAWMVNKYFNDQTTSEELTGDVKLRIIESMEELKGFEDSIGKAILELERARNKMKIVRLEHQRNGLDRIQRVLQYRKTYRGERY
jgi:hypothetical protein